MMVKAIPDEFTAITPHLICRDCAKAIEWYKQALGAVELGTMMMPDGNTVMHASIQIGGAVIMLAEECPDWGSRSPLSLEGSPVTIHLYVEDADAVFNQAVEHGANGIMPVMDAFWGDRYGKFIDPFGHHWSVATHTRDLTPEQIAEGAQAAFASMGAG